MKRNMVISLMGRPNVGKSSLFNRLIGKSFKNLTFDRPGVTRDRHYGIATLEEGASGSCDCILVDTGGFYPQSKNEIWGRVGEGQQKEDKLFKLMVDQVQIALEESDLILVVVDVRQGLLPFDETIVRTVRAREKPFWLLMNKYDSYEQEGVEGEFYSLGAQRFFALSAVHGRGLGELREQLYEKICNFQKEATLKGQEQGGQSLQRGIRPKQKVVGSLALVGAPNVGKSTLLNQLVGEHRALVSDIPGTTVDPIEGFFDLYFGPQVKELKKEDTQEEEEDSLWRSLHLVDTAGIRKKSLIDDQVESQSVFRALKRITESDIILFLVNSVQGLTHQDRRLIHIALEKGKSVIVLLNKIDLLEDQLKTFQERQNWLEDLRYEFPWLNFCEFIPISARYNKGLKKLHQSLIKTLLVRHRSIPTSTLNRVFHQLFERNPIMISKGRGTCLKLKYASMVKSTPPTFLLSTNKSKGIPENYKRYLKNGLRQEFDLANTPIHLILRTSSELSQRSKE